MKDDGTAAPSEPISAKAEARGAAGIYPMRVAVQLTGLTPDTIRAWERRYNAIDPVRSAGNTRKFTQHDIRRLLLLREATEAGHSIGNIAELDDEALRGLKLVLPAGPAHAVDAPPEPAVEPGRAGLVDPIAGYLEPLGRFDVVASASWLRRVAAFQPPRAFVLDVLAPLLAGIREQRADARLGGPHVVVAWQQLTATLTVLLEVTAAPRQAPAIVAVGAPRQRHALHAMAAALLARHHGHEAAFLGAAMQDADVAWSVEALGARTVVVDLSVPITSDPPTSALASLERLATRHRVLVLWPTAVAPSSAVLAGEAPRAVLDLAALDALFAADLSSEEP